MGQPTFIGKIDGSSASASSLTLTRTTTSGHTLLVGVILNANGSQSNESVEAIVDSAGSISGVPVNNWAPLGNNSDEGLRLEWWVCKGAASITSLTINLSGLQSIIAIALEYSGANGITFPIFQALLSSQNTITSQHIHEMCSIFPNSGAELMIGLYAMLGDTFNGTPLEGTARSTNSLSIPPALSYQIVEQGTVDDTGLLNTDAVSATQLASSANVAQSTMQCFFILISGGLVLNTQPGFSDQPASALTAGKSALGVQLAKINGNAALGMCRMEFFQGVYTNGQTVDLPISPVDGYQYQRDELIYIWGIYSTADTGDGWLTGPAALWYCQWKVDQETGEVTCFEVYRSDGDSGVSNDGFLQVFTIAQRQRAKLTVGVSPIWTQQQPSDFVEDYPYAQDVLQALNDNAKFSVIAQECISMGEFYDGQTVPPPVSPADAYAYAYSEVKFVFSWRWTTGQTAFVQLQCPPYYNLASLHAVISGIGAVTCRVGIEGQGGEGYAEYSTFGRIAVFALCQRARTGAPAAVASNFAEIPNSLFFPGNPLPAGVAAQLVNNINEAALSPEFFGPTLYAPGDTIPTPVSPIDGYAYSRAELIYIWDWNVMYSGPYPGSPSDHARCALFKADINQSTGAVTDVVWRLAPGGPYVETTIYGHVSVLVCGFRASQATAFSTPAVTAPAGATSAVADGTAQGQITVNGV